MNTENQSDVGSYNFNLTHTEMTQQEIINMIPDATTRKRIKPHNDKDYMYGEDDPEVTEDTRRYGWLIAGAALFIATFFVVGLVDFVQWIISLI